VITERLAGWSSRRPWLTIGVWALVLVAAASLNATFLGDSLSGDEEVTSQTESRRANELQQERFPRGARARAVSEVVVVRSKQSTVGQRVFRERVHEIAAEVRRAGASRVVTYYDTGQDRLVSNDRDATAMLVALGSQPEDRIDGVVEAVQRANGQSGFDVSITGAETLDADFSTLAGDDLRNGELRFGVPAALIVLLLVFGSVVAGLIPLLMAIVSIAVAFSLIALVGQVSPLSVFATNMLTGMGLALGVDYSLFVLSRYREERSRGREKLDAIAVVGATASRAVLFSGIAFTLAMIGLLLVPHTLTRSLACGAIAAGLASIAVALTLLPALLGLLGDRVNSWRIPFFGRAGAVGGSPFWSRAVGVVMRQPLLSLILVTAGLLAMAIPVISMRSGEAGVSTLPDRLASKQGFVALNAEFPGETTDPVEIVIDGDARPLAVRRGIERLETELAREPLFRRPSQERSPAGDLTVMSVPIRGDADGSKAVDAVRRLRSDLVPIAFPDPGPEVLVSGETAESIDASDTMTSWLPVVFAFVLGLTFVLLTVAFRSLVVAREGGRHQPAVRERRLRSDRARLPGGSCKRLLRLPADRHNRALGATVPIRRPLRSLNGLPRVPAEPDSRALQRDRRQRGRCAVWRGVNRTHHHRRRPHHRRRVQRIRRRRSRDVSADGVRRGRRAPARRVCRPAGTGPCSDETARQPQLVPALVARVDS
jgi:uncharacterized membrane protein YdfJ with MMPL/SSD domain